MCHVLKSAGWQTRGENGKAPKATLRFLTAPWDQLKILSWGWARRGHLVLSWLDWRGEVLLLVLVGREHLGLNILLCIGQAPTTKILKPKMLVVLDLGNIGLIEWTPLLLRAKTYPSFKVQLNCCLFQRASLNCLLLTSQESMPRVKQLLFTRHLS